VSSLCGITTRSGYIQPCTTIRPRNVSPKPGVKLHDLWTEVLLVDSGPAQATSQNTITPWLGTGQPRPPVLRISVTLGMKESGPGLLLQNSFYDFFSKYSPSMI